MGVTEISLHFRKGEEDKRRSRKAARCERKHRARERCFIFPLRRNAWTSSFFFYMVENARSHAHIFNRRI